MVTDISEIRLIMLFTEALTEPLWGWVKSYRPTTLTDAISWTRYLQDVVPKNRFPPRTNVPIKIKKGNHGLRKNGWTMIPDKTLEEKSYVSLARNHGYQVTDVQEKERPIT